MEYFKKDGLWWFRLYLTHSIYLTSDQGFKRKAHCRRSAAALKNCKASVVKWSPGWGAEWKNANGQVLAVSPCYVYEENTIKNMEHLSRAIEDLDDNEVKGKSTWKTILKGLLSVILVAAVMVALMLFASGCIRQAHQTEADYPAVVLTLYKEVSPDEFPIVELPMVAITDNANKSQSMGLPFAWVVKKFRIVHRSEKSLQTSFCFKYTYNVKTLEISETMEVGMQLCRESMRLERVSFLIFLTQVQDWLYSSGNEKSVQPYLYKREIELEFIEDELWFNL